MSWRTVVISSSAKLDYQMGYMVVRRMDTLKIHLSEMEMLIVESTAVSLTAALLSELTKKKIKVIFCDAKSNPQFELTPYYNNYCTYKKIMNQINFNNEFKDIMWSRIIYEKINNEYRLLKKVNNPSSEKLKKYLSEIEDGDKTNREGHAAKVYFNSLFNNTFFRDDDKNPINKYLNYGYSILVSSINREIKSFGYLTELGIHHKGETNSFNLSYDFIEPLRTLIDSYVVLNKVNDSNYKDTFIKMLSSQVLWKGKVTYLDNAIHLYVQGLLNCLSTNDISEISFIEYEL